MILQEKLWGLTNMGQLNSETKYIYERADGIVYAREFGAEPSTRKEVGWDYDHRTSDGRPLSHHIMEDKMWGDIRKAASTNPSLQKALDNVILIYKLSYGK
jgi:hypothetical protein